MLRHSRRRDRQAVRRRRARRGRAEGHRPLDRAERPRPRASRSPASPRPTFARALSGHAEQRAAARRRSSGPTARGAASLEVDRDAFVDDVRAALYASKVVAYAQGFDQIAAGAEEYGWDIDLGAMATIWRGGCIIRAQFLDRITEAYDDEPDLTTLLDDAVLRRRGQATAWTRWRGWSRRRRAAGVPDPGVLLVAGLLRRAAPRAAARRADPGAARLLRRAHLPARRPRGHVPHPVAEATASEDSAG